ncbi:MAG: VWA domain-containing protein [Spirochaetales bacterium]|nr:VWA domain-containing protein [Spirochaetales bacterium]
MKNITYIVILISLPFIVWGGAQAESSGSATRGKYLAGQGIIIPPDEVHVDSYIAQIDYHYPEPEGVLGVTMYNGHRQISSEGQDEVIQVGIQAKKMQFESLPPMNLAFVIDKSGSMSAANKMDWVKESFNIFIQKVRDIDFVSLIVFDNSSQVIFPSTRMSSETKRLEFKNKVEQIEPGGGTNLVAGLKLGYEQVLSNFRSEYTNRVLFLTDGVGDSGGILKMAETYKEMGINVSTIGLGTNFDVNLMRDLARAGGGSSRFISDREEMEETFGTELDRMVVPAAGNLEMTFELHIPGEIKDTWGYQNKIDGKKITYYLPTLHHRDYETILVHVGIPKTDIKGKKEVARFTMEYTDLEGKKRKTEPLSIFAQFTQENSPIAGFSDVMVLQSGTMMRFALELKKIGSIYYNLKPDIDVLNQEKADLWQEDMSEKEYEKLTNPKIEKLQNKIRTQFRLAMDLTVGMRKELKNVRLRLDNVGFENEIMILDKYVEILGKELSLHEEEITDLKNDMEIPPDVKERTINDHLSNLYREMVLDLAAKENGTIAVSGFSSKRKKEMKLLTLLNEMAILEISKLDNMKLVERNKLDKILEEQELSLSALMDTSKAIRIGNLLSAQYILTGTVIEMDTSVVIFGRIINVETGEIESVAQVIVDKNKEVNDLLK